MLEQGARLWNIQCLHLIRNFYGCLAAYTQRVEGAVEKSFKITEKNKDGI